jgi:hypothetical protein
MKRATASALLILLVTAAGCSDRSAPNGGGDSGGNPPQTTVAQAGTGPGAPTSTNAPGQAAGPASGQPGVAPPEIARILDRARSGEATTFTATYRLTHVVSGVKSVSTWRLAQQPPKFRFERLSGGARDIWVFDGRVLHSCTRPGGRLRCLESAEPDDETAFGTAHPAPFIDQLSSLTPLIGMGMSVKRATRTVAGQRLECAVFTSAAPAEPPKLLCTTSKGVVGYAQLGNNTLALTALSQGVRARDFVAPA